MNEWNCNSFSENKEILKLTYSEWEITVQIKQR